MKISTLHEIQGVLVEAGRTDLAEVIGKISVRPIKPSAIKKSLTDVSRSGNYVIVFLKDGSRYKGRANDMIKDQFKVKNKIIKYSDIKHIEEHRMNNDKIVRKYVIEL